MDKNIEELFVKKFIVKDKRERILYELSSEKKRKDRTYRIYGDLDKRYLVYTGQLSEKDFPDEVKKSVGRKTDCYVIADGVDDGTTLPFGKAFDNLVQSAGAYFIFCAPNVVIAKDEVDYGAPSQCILYHT